ncbi:MAG: hypothetical protein AAF391_11370, partial [Bacteroidota bacterium]
MKKAFIIIILSFCTNLILGQSSDCEDFQSEEPTWYGINPILHRYQNDEPSADGTTYLYVHDDANSDGRDFVYTRNEEFNIELEEGEIGCLCWDYKVFDEGYSNETREVIPELDIFRGFTVDWSPMRARFIASGIPITEDSDWVNICAPLGFSDGSSLPANEFGEWQMVAGDYNDWNALMENMSGIGLVTDVVGSRSPSEEIGLDNVCIYKFQELEFLIEDENQTARESFCPNEDVFISLYSLPHSDVNIKIFSIHNETEYFVMSYDWNGTAPSTLNLTSILSDNNNGATEFREGRTYRIKVSSGENCTILLSKDINIRSTGPIDYNFVDDFGVIKNQFCLDEGINIDASATIDTDRYYLDLWFINANGEQEFVPADWRWVFEDYDSINLSGYFDDLGVTLVPGVQYLLNFAIIDPECGWLNLTKPFSVKDCCDQLSDAGFSLNVDGGSSSYEMFVDEFETYDFLDATHYWYVLEGDSVEGPYTTVAQVTSTVENNVIVFEEATYGKYYKVIHKVESSCGSICSAIIQYQEQVNFNSTFIIENIDCEDIPPCVIETPTNLRVENGFLTWDPVPNAAYYIVSSPSDPGVSFCQCDEFVPISPERVTNTNSLRIPVRLVRKCFLWQVRAVCADGTTSQNSITGCYQGSGPGFASEGSHDLDIAYANGELMIRGAILQPLLVEVFDFRGKTQHITSIAA